MVLEGSWETRSISSPITISPTKGGKGFPQRALDDQSLPLTRESNEDLVETISPSAGIKIYTW